jgi:hypothetical protein
MVYAKYRLSDGQFLCGWPQQPPYDPATEGVEQYLEHLRPDMRLHRYDGTAPDKKRLATTQELAAFDTARMDAEAISRMDAVEVKMLKAVVIWAASKLGVQPATARSEILTIYKGLP